MCGIVGIHGSQEVASGLRMLRRLTHRGPDGQGAVALPSAWLGHRRLSIVDPSGGRQPLTSEDGCLHLVANGEIYNHADLRDRFEGELFTSNSDSEVVLNLLQRDGPCAFEDLTGMFALLVAGDSGTFVAARDAVGVKPLYWARRDGEVRFASEIRAFDPDWQPHVEFFPPGHYWTPDEGLVRFASPVPTHRRERFPRPSGLDDEPPAEMIAELRAAVETGVHRRMMADVPVGVFLSGGLDSSIVAAIAAEYLRERGRTLQTFAVGSEDSADLRLARIVADKLGTEHHERIFTPAEARAVLPDVVRIIESFDASLVRSAVPNYFLSELAVSQVKVVLTGEGADELFAGYDYQQAIEGDTDLHDEIVRTVESLHGLNLQRCDRVTMAHGLEAREPFLDLDLIALSLAIPAGWKLRGPGRPAKWLLRRAFQDVLPEEVLWRDKAEFGDGSGAAVALRPDADDGHEAEVVQLSHGATRRLRSAEEAEYYRIFCESFGDISPDRTITQFATA